MLSLLNRSWKHSGMLQHTGRLFYLTKRITTSLRLIRMPAGRWLPYRIARSPITGV